MAIVFNMRCLTCGEVLAGVGDVETHIAANPTHIVSEVVYDDSQVTPPASEGITFVKNNELYIYDASRERYLSVNRSNVYWGTSASKLKKSWLKFLGSLSLNHSDAGHLIKRDSVITKMLFSREASYGDASVILCRNFDREDIVCECKLDEKELTQLIDDIDIEVKAGTRLHCYHESSGGSQDPYVWIEWAWRTD